MTAQTIYDQATDQITAGTSPDIDALRAKVQLQTREQQLIQARNNFSIQKLVLARAIGLAPGQEFHRLRQRCEENRLGVRLEDLSVGDLHPPQEVGGAYHQVTEAMEKRDGCRQPGRQRAAFNREETTVEGLQKVPQG